MASAEMRKDRPEAGPTSERTGRDDPFAVFGLEPRYDLDLGDLRRRYFRASRDVHPDRAAGGASEVAGEAEQSSARVNRAFERLNDPVSRAESLLSLAGGKSAAEDKTVPQDVLTQTLLIREEIDEAKTASDEATLTSLRVQVQSGHERLLAEIAEMARSLPQDRSRLSALREKLNAIKYYQRMAEQL